MPKKMFNPHTDHISDSAGKEVQQTKQISGLPTGKELHDSNTMVAHTTKGADKGMLGGKPSRK